METEIMETIRTVLEQGDLILRHQLRDFEERLAAFVGTQFAVGTSNCTDALHLSLRAAGIGAGDEVITVSHTFVATAAAIHHVGATPILADIGDDHNIDVKLVEQAVTQRTKAILPVHLNGRLCDMEHLMSVAKRHNLIVIEDSAQALGASFKGKRGGSFGLAGCFSFYPAKLLGAFGDAGAMTTNDETIAQKVRSLRDHGRNNLGGVDGWSFNCRMDNLQAALLNLKMEKLSAWIERRRQIARLYHERLLPIQELRLPPLSDSDGIYYDVFQNYEIEAKERNALVRFLKNKGIEVLIPWGGKGVHQFKNLGLSEFHLPRTERLFQEVLLLPLHPELSDNQIEYVSDAIHEFYHR
ncbi:MAG: DegT/DnrJ/EryC1/StrS family aminotransferase [Candidatus Omnitrophica bacterium]|nr:DegT/DnrJ/EryC1/StrS family aminotransferase [Candidatus Omnitrophota bacterium]